MTDEPAAGAFPQERLLSPRFAAALVGLALLLYGVPLTLGIPLLDPDEGLHASISQEMVEDGDYVTPRFLGQAFLDKPILFFWIQAASLEAFGMTEPAVRLPGLLFGLLGVVTTGLLARALYGSSLALLAAGLLATMVLPLAQAIAGAHDVMLVTWVNLSLLCLWRACGAHDATRAAAYGALAGVWLGLAILTKGLAGPAFVYLAFGTAVLLRRNLTMNVISAGIVSLVVGVSIAAPWYILMDQANPGYLSYYFGDRHLRGFLTDTQRHGGAPWWYYLPIVVGGALPWAVYLPVAGLASRQATSVPGARNPEALAWAWLLSGLLFLSVSSSKLPTYALPLFPPLAILAAVAWRGALTRHLAGLPRKLFSLGLVTHATIAVLLLPITALVAGPRFQVSFPPVVWLVVLLVILGHWFVVRLGLRQPEAGALFALASISLVYLTTMSVLLPRVAERVSARELAAHFSRAKDLPDRLLVFDERLGSIVFYLPPRLRAQLTPASVGSLGLQGVVERLREMPDDTIVAVRDSRYGAFARSLPVDGPAFARAGSFRLFHVRQLVPQ